jgi:hypothetical protein
VVPEVFLIRTMIYLFVTKHFIWAKNDTRMLFGEIRGFEPIEGSTEKVREKT